jgi:FkbM family methyltransferase
MGKYSQYNEESFLTTFFNSITNGLVVEIGAADGISNSNSRYLIEMGWSGLLVEPNKKNYIKIKNLYLNNDNVIVENVGCSNVSLKNVDFFIDKNDEYEQLSTFSIEQKNKCITIYGCSFDSDKIHLIKTSELFEKNKISYIDFLSVDTESFDTNVILGIDFNKVKIKLICVEHISNEMINYLNQMNYKEVFRTSGNIFFESI